MTPTSNSRSRVRALLRATFACAVASVCVLAWGATTFAATSTLRPQLQVDRGISGSSTLGWDELGAELRQQRASRPVGLASTVDGREFPALNPALDDACGTGAAVGDLNGDGFDDLVAGCVTNDASGVDAGSIQVRLRNGTNSGFLAATEIVPTGAAAGDRCGVFVDVGDVNGDDLGDIAVGCHQDDTGAVDAGSVHIVTRNAANTGFDPSVELLGPSPVAGDWCGVSVDLYDLDGDGRDDIVMGCAYDDTGAADAGAVVVRLRDLANTGFNAGTLIAMPGPTASDQCGLSTVGADVDGDGRGDIVVGCKLDDSGGVNAGSAKVFLRNATNTGYVAGIELLSTGAAAGDTCRSVAAGDVNGDTRDDIVLGCYLDDSGAVDAGEVQLFTRNAANSGFDAGVPLVHPSPAVNDQCGFGLGVRDLDGDGLGDVFAGCQADDTGAVDAGALLVHRRNSANTGFDPGVMRANPTPVAADNCGYAVAAGDVNGDGVGDAAMGCFDEDTGASGAGSLALFSGVSPAHAEVDWSAAIANDLCGRSVATGDVNGDGLGDIAFGCTNHDTGGANTGSISVHVRNAADTGFLTAVEVQHPAPTASDQCGSSVAIADVNGDGRDDLAFGCQDALAAAGSTVIATRNVANNGFDAGTVVNHPTAAAGDQCGDSIAVGDVNGDERSDVLVGCNSDDTSVADGGSALLVLRNAANTAYDPAQLLVQPTPAAGDACGDAVAIGDLNGDELGDIAIGCNLADVGAINNAGNVVLFVRDATNTGFDPAVTIANPAPGNSDECGASVAIGDVSGDGRGDLAFGCLLDDSANTDAGSLVVATRDAGNTGFDAALELQAASPSNGDRCGSSVTIADVTADGRGDLVGGCRYRDWTGVVDAGSVVAFARNSTNTGFDAAMEWGHTPPTASDECGSPVTTTDIDADGRADLVAGCWKDDTGGSAAGSVIMNLSSATGTTGTLGTVSQAQEVPHPSPNGSELCGRSIESGDFDGNGRMDIVVGCFMDDTGATDSGNAIVYLRNAANTGYDAGHELQNPAPLLDDQCGFSVAAGDTDADGRDDVLMGCFKDDIGATTDAGSMYLFIRNTANTGFDPGIPITHPTLNVQDLCGHGVAFGDVNGDGRDDPMMGCYENDAAGPNAGSLVVFTRNVANTGFDPGVQIVNTSPALNDWCGFWIATGDVNGDGRDDPMLGCYQDDAGGLDTGEVIVFTRDAANTGFDPGVDLYHPSPNVDDRCAVQFTTGDVNGDRRDDVLMGCYRHDTGAVNSGDMVVFERNAANTGFTSTVLENPSPSASTFCGWGVAIGDIDGDGLGDPIMGCYGADLGANDAGLLVAFKRSADNTGYETGVRLGNPTPAANDFCAQNMAVTDQDGDGRDDIAVGCPRDDLGAVDAGSFYVLTERSSTLETTRLDKLDGRVTGVTITTAQVANRAAPPRLQATADGGGTWENVTTGVPLVFAVPGSDLRLRVALPQAPSAKTAQVVHELIATVTYTPYLPPDPPSLVSPAAAASTPDTTPTLTATFTDGNPADTGTLEFEACTVATIAGQSCAAAGGSVLATGSSPPGIVNGANDTWTVSPALVPQVLHWHARGIDQMGRVGAWAASRSLTIAETITVGVDSGTSALGALVPGTNGTSTSVVTIDSNDPQGYTLAATDESDVWGADCVCGGTVPDWTGTNAAPSTWTAGVSGYIGLTVRDVSGVLDNRLPKWGAVNASGWPATDFANNLYAGLDLGSSVLLHQTAVASPTDTVTVTWRANVSASQSAGAYDAQVVITALGRP